jgi:membrane-associated two-gene conflict system component 1 (EACC1)
VHVERTTRPAPESTKGLDATTIDALLVSLGGAGGALTALVGVLRAWVTRGSSRKLVLKGHGVEIEVTGATDDLVQQLLALFASSVEHD